MVLTDILKECGLPGGKLSAVSGGDINKAYCIDTGEQRYFLKLNNAEAFPFMMQKEAAGLTALRNTHTLNVPQVIKTGNTSGKQFLLMEWFDRGPAAKDSMKNFGKALAMLHRIRQEYVGFDTDNYIGSLYQLNTVHTDWYSFYSECRIMPLVNRLFDAGMFAKADLQAAISLTKRLKDFFPDEPPALLHGDLWAGNYFITAGGNAAVFDPAVYYGHREMDIGMTRLFGGFDHSFYTAYHETYPLEKNWEQRLPLTQLYPLLVHAILFGGHYIQQAREIIKQFS
jgi:fructosamine-3-kinase